MCKDKWNGLNSNYNKISSYHIGTCKHTWYWVLTINECDKYHLLQQFKKEYYEAIELF
jgi:hypothetical protein